MNKITAKQVIDTPTDTPTNDCISRQQAIEELQEYLMVDEVTEYDEFSDGENSGIRMAISVVDNLQPVEPKINGDCISREQAIEVIENVDWYHVNSKGKLVSGSTSDKESWYKAEDIYEALESLKPVTPTGKVVAEIKVDTEELVERIKEECQLEQDGRLKEYQTDRDKWIPVSERLPQNCEEVIVTLFNKDGITRRVTATIFFESRQDRLPSFGAYEVAEVIAWQPLPEPYKADGKEYMKEEQDVEK